MRNRAVRKCEHGLIFHLHCHRRWYKVTDTRDFTNAKKSMSGVKIEDTLPT